jgi:hypothetical protein
MDAFWSVASMPIGLFACFTPVLIAWLIMGLKGPQKKDRP